MCTGPIRRCLIHPTVLLFGIIAAGCGAASSPASPSPVSSPADVPAVSPPVVAPVPDASPASISSVLPESLPPGPAPQTLVVEGSNFKPGLTADFIFTPSGGSATPAGRRMSSESKVVTGAVQNVTDRSFEVVITVTEPGTFQLRVTNPSSPPSEPVTVPAQPAETSRPGIAGLSPSSPTASADAQPVYVLGANFEPGVAVTIGRPNGSTFTVEGSAIAFGSSTGFRMQVVLADAGNYSVRVRNPSGEGSEPRPVTVKPAEVRAPTVTGITPASPTRSTAAQTIGVTGTDFVPGMTVTIAGPGDTTTTVGGSSVQNTTATSLQMSVVLGTAGSHSLRVTSPSGQTSGPWTFIVKAPEEPPPAATVPTVTNLQPSPLTQSDAIRPLYVSGTNFQTGLSIALTRPNGETSTFSGSGVTLASSTVVQVMATLGAAGAYSLRVVSPSGQASEPWRFTVGAAEVPPPVPTPAPAPTPTVTGLSPASPTVNDAAQTVGVAGTEFAAGLTVMLTRPNGSTVTISGESIRQVASTSFQMSVTLSVAGAYSLRVMNPSGKTSESKTFSVKIPEATGKPTVTSISPTAPVTSTEAKPFYVSGTNFQAGLSVTLVSPTGQTSTFGGTAITVGSSTVFAMKVVFATTGAYSLRVVNASGPSSDAFTFTVGASGTP